MLTEGGNIFKDADGNPATQRINLADIKPTVQWLEQVTGLPLSDNMLGSTGLKPTSGDLDLAVDANSISKEQLYTQLSNYVQQNGQDPRDWVKKSGISVHFKTPIGGRADTGFVQTDFMFMAKPEFSKFILRQDPASEYKGATRNILLNSIGKALGYKLNQNQGMMDRATNELVTDDPDEIARLLLGPKADRGDLGSVEKILAVLKNDPKRDAKLADFRDHMQQAGTPLDESLGYNEVNWLARLRDRIVNQGMQVIVEEQILTEGARIEHPEDMVFDMGSRGIATALAGIQKTAADPRTATVKWDGKPAIIFGRKPTGEFVLTDKAGFLSKSYDGLTTSPKKIEQMMLMRGGERGELIGMYNKLFPLLQRAVPENMRGYVQGDLLYSNTPQVVKGAYQFQPNTVTYRVPTDTDLGKKIGASQAGVVIHTFLSEPGATPKPITAANLAQSPGLLILDPSLKEPRKITLDTKALQNVNTIMTQQGRAIDRLFDPNELRTRKITNLPQLMKMYINSRVRQGGYTNLLADFGPWLQAKEPAKAPRIFQWANENKEAVAAVFNAFLQISNLKNNLVQQLDQQGHDVQASVGGEIGHEGYVGSGMKFVDRMRFSAANFAKNNPEQG